MGLDPKSKERESPVSFTAIIYIYLMRIVASLNFFSHINPAIFHYQSLMRLVVFNGRKVREGTSQTDRWKAVDIRELTTTGFYDPLGSGNHENRNNFVPYLFPEQRL